MTLFSSVFILASLASAQSIQTGVSIQTFPMAGIAEGQTARLSVLNPGVQAPAATAALCSARLSFLDDENTLLKTSTVTVAPGHSLMLDLDADTDLKLAVDQRRQIRASIQIPPDVSALGMPVSLCTLVPTLEIFDRVTGKTQVLLVDTHPVPGFVIMGNRR